eukprot:1657384-Pyramimonas_sp.AAC.1
MSMDLRVTVSLLIVILLTSSRRSPRARAPIVISEILVELVNRIGDVSTWLRYCSIGFGLAVS